MAVVSTVAQWLALPPHSKTDHRFDFRPDVFQCGVYLSPCRMDYLWVLRLPLSVQKHACEVD